MAKQQDFAEKVKKAGAEKGTKCPKCGAIESSDGLHPFGEDRNWIASIQSFARSGVQMQ